MSALTTKNVRITGLSACVPSHAPSMACNSKCLGECVVGIAIESEVANGN